MPRREEIRAAGVAPPMGLFVDAVRFGDLVFVSGSVGIDADGRLAGPDIESQTRQMLRNIGAALEAAGASFADVLRETTYVLDIEQRAAMRPVRAEFYGTMRPASTLVEVSALAVPGALVEMDVVAGVPS
jgi:enamine deaminase RidA (YjgF/YER057c/UK114 family)